MKIKFEPVRIGKFRKDLIQERILKENYLKLKHEISVFVESIQSDDTIDVDIVIPEKGNRISITLDSIEDNYIKNQLMENFPNSIYNGDYNVLYNNSTNLELFPIGI
mgnify:CR=1 FL=1|jgi:hypothetical protein